MLRLRRLIPAVLALAGLSIAPLTARSAPHLVRTLPNKAMLVIRENRTRPLVTIQAWIKSGARNETTKDRGVAWVLPNLLLEATKMHAPDQLQQELVQYGGTFGIEVGYSYSMIQITIPARSFSTGLNLLAEAIIQPRMEARDLEQAKARTRTESRSVLAGAERASVSTAREGLHSGNPLAYPIAVPELEISQVTMPLAQRFYAEQYVAENLMVVVVGDVEPAEAAQKVEAAFRGMPRGKASSARRVTEKALSSPKVFFEENPKDTEGSALTVAFRAPAWGSADAVALDVLLAVLVDSPNSRAQKRLVEGGGEPAVDLVAALRDFGPDGGTVTISARGAPEKLRDAETTLLTLLAQARTTPVTADELQEAAHSVLSRELFQEADVTGIGRATAIAVLQGRPGADEVLVDRLKAIRPEDLAAVAGQYLDLRQAAVVEMAPRSAADSLGLKDGFEKRIRDQLAMNEAAYKKGPGVTQSADRERRARIDAPLSRIPSAPLEPGRARVERSVRTGGLKLLISEDRSVPLVTVGVYLAGGVRYENERNNGVTALLRETLLTSSDPKAGGVAYRLSLPALGALLPYQDRDMWGFSLSVPADSWREALHRLGAMFAKPELDTITVDATRLHVLSNLDKWLEDDGAQRSRLIFTTKYEVSGYRLPGLGTRKNMITMPLDEVQEWHRRFVVRPNMVVAVFGDVRPGEVGPAVDQAFGEVSGKAFQPGPVPKEPPFEGFREKWELGGGPDATVTLAFNGPPATSSDIPALYVVNSLLSGPRGWFHQYLDSSPALIRGSTSIVSHALDESPIVASATVRAPAQEEAAVKLLFRQFKKVAFLPLTGQYADTLSYAKANAIGTYLATLGSNSARAFQNARAELFGLGLDYPVTLPARMDAVTAEDLLRIGHKYFEKDEFNVRPYAIAETRPGGW